uniref:Uncharacterized protein n=1 Tax=Arundo donax TaxID=35708 RepID=A0A0A9B5B1_ARUDO
MSSWMANLAQECTVPYVYCRACLQSAKHGSHVSSTLPVALVTL